MDLYLIIACKSRTLAIEMTFIYACEIKSFMPRGIMHRKLSMDLT